MSTNKKVVKSIRLDQVLNSRISTYAATSGKKESDAIRDLLEKGLACEALSVYATPVGQLIRDIVEAEFNLLFSDLEGYQEQLENRLAKVCSRGTKASLQTAVMLTDVSRALIPAWRNIQAKELWKAYSQAGGELQSGHSYEEVKAGLS